MVTVVNYGLGNVQAFVNIYRRLNVPVDIADSADGVARSVRLILPGVGAFDWAMTRLNTSGMRDALDDAVLRRKTPVLGVCVGMQMMAAESEEGTVPGLGWIPARVRKLRGQTGNDVRLPHMGWNDVKPVAGTQLFTDTSARRFYFLHSFHLEPTEARHVAAHTDYGQTFVSAIQAGGIHGTQFHPEKSHAWGVELLKKFAGV